MKMIPTKGSSQGEVALPMVADSLLKHLKNQVFISLDVQMILLFW
jgi:hypothetical protein